MRNNKEKVSLSITKQNEGPKKDDLVITENVLIQRYSNREPRPGIIDSNGRAVTVGRRKTAVAQVFMVPGDGKCFVNGRPAIEYFARAQELFHLAEPFEVAGAFGCYNAWCLVNGGGLSGQAGAVMQALAKALVLFRPECHDAMIRAGGLIRRDPRMVERKKAGQPKARKKFTWVKR